jgi:hypothetical protein
MLVVGRWSLVAGRWSLVVGRWSLVVSRRLAQRTGWLRGLSGSEDRAVLLRRTKANFVGHWSPVASCLWLVLVARTTAYRAVPKPIHICSPLL